MWAGFELGIQRAFDTHLVRHEEGQVEGSQNKHSANTPSENGVGRQQRAVCVAYSEIDKYAIATYEHNWKGHTNYGDATTINERQLPDFDLLVGGFPCQAFSVAGKRHGFNDTRGTLFFDIARILKHKRPRHLVLENVKGLLSHDSGKTFSTILGVLTDIGYDVEWQVLNAKDFGVPQNRERVFIVGHLGGKCRRQVFPIGTSGTANFEGKFKIIDGYNRKYSKEIGTVRQNMLNGGSLLQMNNPTHSAVKASEGSGNRLKIQQLNQPTHSNDRVYADDGISPTLNTAQRGNRQPFVSIKEATKKGYAEATVGDTLNISVPTSKTRRGRVQKGMAGTLQTGESMATLTPDARIRRLTPLECERLMSWPDNWTIGSDTQRYKQCGNGVVSNCVQAVIEELKPCLL